jgi:C-terminal processing protease CtpA/Prc
VASVFIVLTQTGTLQVRNVSLHQAANDALGNYDLLVSEMDQRYSYFAVKQIDWRARAHHHRVRARAGLSRLGAVQRLLQELNDPHVVIIPEPGAPPLVTATPNTKRNFDLAPLLARIHKQQRTGMQMITGKLKEGFGYALIGSLQPKATTAEAMAKAFEALYDRPGIILDLRANGGGDERVAQTILRGLVQERAVYAQNRTRSGPAADDFTPPQSRVLHVSRDPSVPRYDKPVVALIGPVCMSSGEAMALMCKALPNVTVIGQPTRGASGNPKPIQLANGVVVVASTWIAMDAAGKPFEGIGVQPDELVEHGEGDPTLDRAIAILKAKAKQ